jgi:response regulator NasT
MTALAVPTVLTVEDDPFIRADLQLLLEDAGFSVCPAARDGIEAIELARAHDPDVILLDLGLPLLDGAEATRRIRLERDVPIVALAEERQGDLVDRAVQAGASAWIQKPFEDGALVGAVREALVRHADDAIRAARDESRCALSELARALGYPQEYAVRLERRSFEQGRLWRRAR